MRGPRRGPVIVWALGALCVLPVVTLGEAMPVAAPPMLSSAADPPSVPVNLPAQAEVHASSGPVELTLRLYKTRIRPKERLWYQLRLRNVGSKPFAVGDDIFRDPIQTYSNYHVGIYFLIIGPDGKELRHRTVLAPHHDVAEEKPGRQRKLHPDDQKDLDSLLAQWRSEGLDIDAINRKLLDWLPLHRPEDEIPAVVLKPGESVTTKPWAFYEPWDQEFKRPPPQPIGEFTELFNFDLNEAGKYRFRAVYDYRPSEWFRDWLKKHGMKEQKEHDVLAETPWIEVERRP